MKVLIAAGGTGGHLYPAIALGRELKKINCEFLFAATANPAASKALEKEKFSVVQVRSAPFPSLFANLQGVFQSLDMLKDFQPGCIIGFGAYASVPVVLAGAIKRIPIVIHEQNVVPGRANSLCALFARKVAVSFPQALNLFSGKAVLTGNPVREDLFRLDQKTSLRALALHEGRKTILVFGGSAGAKSVNRALLEAIGKLTGMREKIQFAHLTGHASETEILKAKYSEAGFSAYVADYAEHMNHCYGAADLVISRAGAGTVAELVATKSPAILIPYPFASRDHQTANAEVLKSFGSAEIVRESESLSSDISEWIRRLIESPEKLKNMKDGYHRFPISLEDAPKRLANLVLSQCV